MFGVFFGTTLVGQYFGDDAGASAPVVFNQTFRGMLANVGRMMGA